MDCVNVNDFIIFCENDEDAADNLYYYCKHLLYNKLGDNDVFFDMLYDSYCKKRNIIKEPEHYSMSRFVAFETFLDEAIRCNYNIMIDRNGLIVPHYTKNRTINFGY